MEDITAVALERPILVMIRITRARLPCQTADIRGSNHQLSRMLTLADTSSVPFAVIRLLLPQAGSSPGRIEKLTYELQRHACSSFVS
jgi:hypothetical protein